MKIVERMRINFWQAYASNFYFWQTYASNF